MNRETCHASHDRHGVGACEPPVRAPASGPEPRNLGNHPASAANATTAPQASAECQPPGKIPAKGTEIPDDTAATTPITVT